MEKKAKTKQDELKSKEDEVKAKQNEEEAKQDEDEASDRNKNIAKGVAGGGLGLAGGGVIAAGALLIRPQAIVTVPTLLGVGLFGAAAGAIYSAVTGSSQNQFNGKAAAGTIDSAVREFTNFMKKRSKLLKS